MDLILMKVGVTRDADDIVNEAFRRGQIRWSRRFREPRLVVVCDWVMDVGSDPRLREQLAKCTAIPASQHGEVSNARDGPGDPPKVRRRRPIPPQNLSPSLVP